MIGWKAVREAASRFHPKHTAAAWKHRNLSFVEQEGSRQCRRIEVQSKETLTALWSAWPWTWWQQRREQALPHGKRLAPFPWVGVNDSAEEQRLQADHPARLQESANVQLGVPATLTGAHDPRHALQKNGGLATYGTWMTVTRQHHTRSCCRVWAVHHGPATEQGRCHPRNARARPALPGSADRVRPPSRKSGRQPFTATKILEEQSAAEVFDDTGQRSLERLFRGLTEGSMTQAILSAAELG